MMLGLFILSLALSQPTHSDSNSDFELKLVEKRVEGLLAKMTLREKIGQLIMVGFPGTQLTPKTAKFLSDHHFGSVSLYRRNIRNNQQVAKLVQQIRQLMRNRIQPFVAIDQEGGNVVRIRSDVAVLPGAMTLGATRDPVLAYLAGQANAYDLGHLGIDMNLAPVLDINQNPHNPVINIRALADHPNLVTQLGVWFIQGQQQAGMATVAKHFPGHGTTSSDSHYALPTLQISKQQLETIELQPFRVAIAGGLDAVMTAHINIPSVEPDPIPASISKRVITGLLRKKLNFDGLVITDDLEMRAVADKSDIGQAAVQAIQAGADIVMVIWATGNKLRAIAALERAVNQGIISIKRLDQSVRRVLLLKAKRGTLDAWKSQPGSAPPPLPNSYHQLVMQTIAQRGITLVRNQTAIVPVCSGKDVLVTGPLRSFLVEMKKLQPQATILKIDMVPSEKRRNQILEQLTSMAAKHRMVVIAVVNAYHAWLVQRLQYKTKTPILAVSFGSPYYLRNFPKVAAYLCCYSFLPSVQKAAAHALCGHNPITGRLPINISKSYPRGHGLIISDQRCSLATRY